MRGKISGEPFVNFDANAVAPYGVRPTSGWRERATPRSPLRLSFAQFRRRATANTEALDPWIAGSLHNPSAGKILNSALFARDCFALF
jgi:hypothetical protein